MNNNNEDEDEEDWEDHVYSNYPWFVWKQMVVGTSAYYT